MPSSGSVTAQATEAAPSSIGRAPISSAPGQVAVSPGYGSRPPAGQSITMPTVTRTTLPLRRKNAVSRSPGMPAPVWHRRPPGIGMQLAS